MWSCFGRRGDTGIAGRHHTRLLVSTIFTMQTIVASIPKVQNKEILQGRNKEKNWTIGGQKFEKCEDFEITGQKYENERTVRTPAHWRAGRGLTKGVNVEAEGGGVGGAGRAVSQKTRAKQICDLELGEQPLRRD